MKLFENKTRTSGALICYRPCSTMPFPQLASRGDDGVVEPHNLVEAKGKGEVNMVPYFKVVFVRGYAVSICYVVTANGVGRFTQGTDQGCIWCNEVISINAFIVRDRQ
jgi:hypothetical protein